MMTNKVEVSEISEMFNQQGVIFDEGKHLGRNIRGLRKIDRRAPGEDEAQPSGNER